jgi:ABC-type branched-subunit amino acid transport system substrate-binding protein/streptogramin lyase
VFKRAFARRASARYPSCAELIAAARRPSRRGRGRIVAAVALLVASAALAIVMFGRPAAVSGRSGVLALGADGGVASFTAATTAPSNIAIGEGAVWLLDSEARTVVRIDPDTKAVKRFTVGGQPTDLAVGEGAVWVATGEGSPRATTAIAQVDPRSLKVTATIELTRKMSVYGPGPSEGFPRIAVGAGSVWAVGLDNRIYRIDSASGRIVARIRVEQAVGTIAAGAEGVWFLTGSDRVVRGIDPATNTIADRVPIKSDWLSGIAVGGGAVWVTSPQDGRLWRIAPGRVRAIDVGGFIQFVGYADGAAWTASYREGVVTRIDDRTGARTAVEVGAAQALSVGAGFAWVSVAGGTRDGALPATACTGIEAGGARPDVLFASELPLQGGDADAGRTLADAIRWVLKDHGYRAGRYVVGYQSCDASTVQTGDYENRRCAANAHAFARTDDIVAVIGPFVSFCAQHEIPILNRAPGGPLALVSPTNTDPALTRGPLGALYPTGERNYFRVIGRADVEGVAHALHARRLKLSRVYLLEAGQVDPRARITGPFRRAALALGVGIAGSGSYEADPSSHAALAARVAAARPDGVVIDGSNFTGGAVLIKALRARLGPRAAIMVGDLLSVADVLHAAGRKARGVYVATTEALPVAESLTPAGARFVASFGNAAYRQWAMHAAQAAEVVLQAIEHSDGTRDSVLRTLRSLRVRNGIIGSFAFDRGDITPARVAIMRITGAVTRDAEVPEISEGAEVERVIEVRADLAG